LTFNNRRFLEADVAAAVLVPDKPRPNLLSLLDSQGLLAVWQESTGFSDSRGGRFS